MTNPAGKEGETSEQTELREGQFFFDQPPFSGILAETSQLGIPNNNLGFALVKFAKGNVDSEYLKENAASILNPSFVTAPISRGVDLAKLVEVEGETIQEKLAEVIRDICIDKLGKYPLWIDYVRAKHDPAYYALDGSYKTSLSPKKVYKPIATYAPWVQERLRNRQDLNRNIARPPRQ